MSMVYPCADCGTLIESIHDTRRWYCDECRERRRVEANLARYQEKTEEKGLTRSTYINKHTPTSLIDD